VAWVTKIFLRNSWHLEIDLPWGARYAEGVFWQPAVGQSFEVVFVRVK